MRTTYAVSFTTEPCSQQQRITVIDIVSDWLLDNFPSDKRPAGTFVRTREGTDDPVFRLSIDESPPGGSHTRSFTVTIVYINGSLTFDLRSVLIPTSNRIAPSRSTDLPQALIVQLVARVLQEVTVYDANHQLAVRSSIATTSLQGNTFGAFVDAPSRRLPVLVEVTDYERASAPLFRDGAGPLSGLAHIVILNTPEALRGFNELTGDTILGPGTIRVYWAGRADPFTLLLRETTSNSFKPERDRLVRVVIETGALALASPRVPPPPRDDFEDFEEFEEDLDHDTTADALTSVPSELFAAQNATIDEYERNIVDLQAQIADADRMIGEQRTKLERKSGQVDQLILRNVDLETSAGTTAGIKAVASMKEALRLAQENFTFLTFHENSLESGEQLEGPEPIAVLQDLGRLNEVARAWMSKEISGTSFQLACRSVGLDYVAHVSDNSRQKFEQDYAITWQGRSVLAEAHIRRGKKAHLFRIHIYLDDDTQQVVVAYIGRHLRGKHSSS